MKPREFWTDGTMIFEDKELAHEIIEKPFLVREISPELYAAYIQFIETLEFINSNMNTLMPENGWSFSIEKALAALKKARGE